MILIIHASCFFFVPCSMLWNCASPNGSLVLQKVWISGESCQGGKSSQLHPYAAFSSHKVWSIWKHVSRRMPIFKSLTTKTKNRENARGAWNHLIWSAFCLVLILLLCVNLTCLLFCDLWGFVLHILCFALPVLRWGNMEIYLHYGWSVV